MYVVKVIDNNDYNDYYNNYNDYNNNNDYGDSDLDLDIDLDWQQFSKLVTEWHIWQLLTNCETWIMTLRVSDWQSESDLDSIRNSCDV